ncbi:hypothetical protein [Geitlerinema calcuttense]|uniref:hypothetical protein n=1 Tax=Geitlerinema calcuttense TaxID=1471433 RepID=UPI00255B61AC|nr:hypothetical protein [Geitlerinema calcuttense]
MSKEFGLTPGQGTPRESSAWVFALKPSELKASGLTQFKWGIKLHPLAEPIDLTCTR